MQVHVCSRLRLMYIINFPKNKVTIVQFLNVLVEHILEYIIKTKDNHCLTRVSLIIIDKCVSQVAQKIHFTYGTLIRLCASSYYQFWKININRLCHHLSLSFRGMRRTINQRRKYVLRN